MIYAYASEISNNTLKQEVNFTFAKLKRLRDTDIVPVCRMIAERAAENSGVLKDYGITADLLTDFQEAIDNYSTALPKPTTALGKRKTRKEMLKQFFREIDEILNERMDNLMGKFRTANPEFYASYFNLREFKDPSTTVTQLKGIVTDKSDDKPIKGAVITIVELAKTAKTDSAGEYSLKPIDHGNFTVRIEKEGYAPFENDEFEIKMGDIKHLDVELVSN
jgi:hypothetical protein